MENNEQYQSSVNLIGEVESAKQDDRVVILDMKDVFADRVDMKTYSDRDAFTVINDVAALVPFSAAEEGVPIRRQNYASPMSDSAEGTEARTKVNYMEVAEKTFKDAVNKGMKIEEGVKSKMKKREAEKKSEPAAPKQRAAPEMQIPSPTRQAPQAPKPQTYVQPEIQKPATEPQRQPAPPKADVKKAAEELQAMVPQSRELKENTAPKVEAPKEDELVLPTLSIPEQITELEKIELGLDRNVFNSEQLKVVRDEVNGLAQSVRSHDVVYGSQPALFELRDKKLKAVSDKLRQAAG